MSFEPHFWTTHVGSVPHTDARAVCEWQAAHLDVPAWPQLPRRTFHENMYVQYSAGLPAVVIDEAHEKITVDTSGDLTPALEAFYERYLADDVDSFALPAGYAEGWAATLEALRGAPGEWAKGQVTGPISFGLTVTDQALRCSLYHELLADAIVKQMAMIGRWQARELCAVRPHVLISVDEPYMASFGSAFISLSREHAIAMLDEVFAAIQQEGALASVHCCANTDWSVLLATRVDVLNLDSYGYVKTLALYPGELRAFLDRGGAIMWGLVPNDSEVFRVTPEQLAERFRADVRELCDKAWSRHIEIDPGEFAHRSLISPRCGLGPANEEIAAATFDLLERTAAILRAG